MYVKQSQKLMMKLHIARLMNFKQIRLNTTILDNKQTNPSPPRNRFASLIRGSNTHEQESSDLRKTKCPDENVLTIIWIANVLDNAKANLKFIECSVHLVQLLNNAFSCYAFSRLKPVLVRYIPILNSSSLKNNRLYRLRFDITIQ